MTDYLDVFSSKLELKYDENSFHVRRFMNSVRPYKKESRINSKFILKSQVSALEDKDIISQLLSKETLGYGNSSNLLDQHYGIDLELLGQSSLIIFLNNYSPTYKDGFEKLLNNGFSVEDILDTIKAQDFKPTSIDRKQWLRMQRKLQSAQKSKQEKSAETIAQMFNAADKSAGYASDTTSASSDSSIENSGRGRGGSR